MQIPFRHYNSDNVVTDPATYSISQNRSGEGKTLLVVDDEYAIRDLMAQILCQEGYTVIQAEDAGEALRLANTAIIHLLLTDFSMPGTDGLELTRRFRAVYPKAPVLMVSGSLDDLHKKAEDLERFSILQKPFETSELVTKVRVLLAEISPLPVEIGRSWAF